MQPEYKVPVFVSPHLITFVLEDKSTHKQVLTLYNPYDFSIRFRVLGTCPAKYIIGNPEGSMPAHYRVDIVIRHNAVTSSNCDVIDKFRIQIYDKNTKQVIGKQDVQSILRSNSGNPFGTNISTDLDEFEAIKPPQHHQHSFRPSAVYSAGDTPPPPLQAPNYVIISIAVICIGGILLPTEKPDGSSNSTFQVSEGFKLVLSFVLGTTILFLVSPLWSKRSPNPNSQNNFDFGDFGPLHNSSYLLSNGLVTMVVLKRIS